MSGRESLVAELWYATAPDLADPLLLAGLRAVSPDAEAQDGSLVVPYDGGERPGPPLVTAILPGSALGTGGKALPDATQTWDWPEVDEALAGARASVLVTEMLSLIHI